METIRRLREHILEIQQKSPLAAGHITLLGASKGQSTSVLEGAITAGLADFGENRVQEAQGKWPALKAAYPHVKLHLIGALQSNKTKEALALFDVIHTLDRPKLAEAIREEMRKGGSEELKKNNNPIPHFLNSSFPYFYIQINTGEEPQKAGVLPKEAGDFIAYCKRDLALPVIGLMCVPPVEEPAAPHFALLRKIALANDLSGLSMGMSNDYETAIRMGSSCVRIGTALFGKRD